MVIYRVIIFERSFHRRQLRRLHAGWVLNLRIVFLYRAGDTRNQAAAAHGNDESVEIWLLLEHLDAERALAGDHGFVVEGMNKVRLLFSQRMSASWHASS